MARELLEIADFVRIDKLPNGVKKEDVDIQFIGETKVRNWTEYTDWVKKDDKKRAKAKINKQLESLPAKAEAQVEKESTLTAEQIEEAITAREAEQESANDNN